MTKSRRWRSVADFGDGSDVVWTCMLLYDDRWRGMLNVRPRPLNLLLVVSMYTPTCTVCLVLFSDYVLGVFHAVSLFSVLLSSIVRGWYTVV